MAVTVVGAGSIGLLVAGKLSMAGEDVVVITRTKEQAERLNREGITLIDEGSRFAAGQAEAFSLKEMDRLPPSEWIIITVKQKHITDRFAAAISAGCTEQTRGVVCFQNGMGHLEKMRELIPEHLLISAVTTEGARRVNEVSVEHTGKGGTQLGFAASVLDKQQELRLSQLEAMLVKAGFTAHINRHIEAAIWEKLAVNAAINPATSILQVSNGELLLSKRLKEWMSRVIEEVCLVGRKEGVFLDVDQLLSRTLEVCRLTSANRSSMLQDRLRSQSTEIDWVNGAVVRLAHKHGLQVPYNEACMLLVKGFEEINEREEEGEGGEQ
ncbi:2-dehydropantoate 2-reductase [Paenibacillus turpanensis]|uniref:2-dehydropantoate 2-reductase n=1 Tax=Paenibacillus turpanensis TaxID=2689078 RepID=UPI00140AC833